MSVARSAAGHVLARGAHGWLDLDEGQFEDADSLAIYGARAAEALRRLEGFPNAGDLVLLGAIDQVTGEVTGSEELVGSRGGLAAGRPSPSSCVRPPSG